MKNRIDYLKIKNQNVWYIFHIIKIENLRVKFKYRFVFAQQTHLRNESVVQFTLRAAIQIQVYNFVAMSLWDTVDYTVITGDLI